jgi:hypothetical protein
MSNPPSPTGTPISGLPETTEAQDDDLLPVVRVVEGESVTRTTYRAKVRTIGDRVNQALQQQIAQLTERLNALEAGQPLPPLTATVTAPQGPVAAGSEVTFTVTMNRAATVWAEIAANNTAVGARQSVAYNGQTAAEVRFTLPDPDLAYVLRLWTAQTEGTLIHTSSPPPRRRPGSPRPSSPASRSAPDGSTSRAAASPAARPRP